MTVGSRYLGIGVSSCVRRLTMSGISAVAEVEIDAPQNDVWIALTDPEMIQKYMFGSVVETDWKPGSSIVWKGEWNGKPFEDKGEVLEVQPPTHLKLTHFSPMSGADDSPENYHTLEYELSEQNGSTLLRLTQDGNSTEQEAKHSKQNWESMLNLLKGVVEARRSS
jgi:uncharacterized protein YndB with AHSA1/START domain